MATEKLQANPLKTFLIFFSRCQLNICKKIDVTGKYQKQETAIKEQSKSYTLFNGYLPWVLWSNKVEWSEANGDKTVWKLESVLKNKPFSIFNMKLDSCEWENDN